MCRKWTNLLDTLGGEEGKNAKSYTVATKQELSALLENPTFAAAETIQLVELMMDKFDADMNNLDPFKPVIRVGIIGCGEIVQASFNSQTC